MEYFNYLLDLVSEEMQIAKDDILGTCRKAEVVDAKWLVVYLMHERGYKTADITPLVGIARRSVDNAISLFLDRVKFSNTDLKYAYCQIKKRLGNN